MNYMLPDTRWTQGWAQFRISQRKFYRAILIKFYDAQSRFAERSTGCGLLCPGCCWIMLVDDFVQAGESGFIVEAVMDLKMLTERSGKTCVLADCPTSIFATRSQIRRAIDGTLEWAVRRRRFMRMFGYRMPNRVPSKQAMYCRERVNERLWR